VATTTAGFSQEILDPELYIRGTEFGALSPSLWWHGLWGLRFPWEYGPQSLEIARRFTKLRYRLLPYMYTYARTAHDTGLPIVRGMFLEYPGQELAYTYRQQYMLGDEMLVAPVTEPGYGKPVFKDTYLPAGDDWYDFFNGKIYKGGQVVPYESPLDRIPVFVRAGSILPLAPEMNFSDERPLDPLSLDIYAGKAASFRNYEDDGLSLDYRKGSFAWTPITYESQPNGIHQINIGPGEGEYRGQIKTRSYELRLHGLLKPGAVTLNSVKLVEKRLDLCGAGCQGWTWDRDAKVTTVRLSAPIDIQKKTTVALEASGTFADAEVLQRVLDYRERLQEVRGEEQMKWAMLLNWRNTMKPPRVMRETDAIERQLDEVIATPSGIAERVPDLRAMTQRLLKAFQDQPFESHRSILEPDADSRAARQLLENAVFEPEEIRKMTCELLGCKLVVRAFGTPSPQIQAKLVYDEDTVGPAKVAYDISLPEEGSPGWIQTKPQKAADGGYTQFSLRAPFLTRPGSHLLKVKTSLAWEGGQLEKEQEVEWNALGGGHEILVEPRLKDTYRNGIVTIPVTPPDEFRP
jgi:hypothetical protein